MFNTILQNVVTACLTAAVLTPPGGDTGGERVSLISGWTGADRPVIHHLAVGVCSTGGVRTLAWIFTPVVKTSSVLSTLAVVETFSSPAGHQGVASVSSRTGADWSRVPRPVQTFVTLRVSPTGVWLTQRPRGAGASHSEASPGAGG